MIESYAARLARATAQLQDSLRATDETANLIFLLAYAVSALFSPYPCWRAYCWIRVGTLVVWTPYSLMVSAAIQAVLLIPRVVVIWEALWIPFERLPLRMKRLLLIGTGCIAVWFASEFSVERGGYGWEFRILKQATMLLFASFVLAALLFFQVHKLRIKPSEQIHGAMLALYFWCYAAAGLVDFSTGSQQARVDLWLSVAVAVVLVGELGVIRRCCGCLSTPSIPST